MEVKEFESRRAFINQFSYQNFLNLLIKSCNRGNVKLALDNNYKREVEHKFLIGFVFFSAAYFLNSTLSYTRRDAHI